MVGHVLGLLVVGKRLLELIVGLVVDVIDHFGQLLFRNDSDRVPMQVFLHRKVALAPFSDGLAFSLDRESPVLRHVFLLGIGAGNKAGHSVGFGRPGPLRVPNGFPARVDRPSLQRSPRFERNRRIPRISIFLVLAHDFLSDLESLHRHSRL